MKSADFSRIERAIRFIDDNVQAQPTLQDLSSYMGLSEYHCHRVFKKWTGVTPKDFLQVLTVARAKKLLSESNTVLSTSFEVGLSGASRLHDLFINFEAMTPGEYKKQGEGVCITWGIFKSPLGKMVLAKTDRKICSLSFVGDSTVLELEAQIKARWPLADRMRSDESVAYEQRVIVDRMSGKSHNQVDLLVKGTPFQVQVWRALLSIPEGETTTYSRIAKAIGSEGAYRAVGTAVGSNPIGYLIPCHRVIKSTGAIGEYHWGRARKEVLLSIEYARVKHSIKEDY